MQNELVANQRVTQADLEFLALRELGVECVRVVLEATATVFLRLQHRDVSGFNQTRSRVARIGIQCDADAWRCVHLAAANLIFLREDQQQFLRCGGGIARLAEVFETNDERVATPAPGEITDTQVVLQSLGDLAQ